MYIKACVYNVSKLGYQPHCAGVILKLVKVNIVRRYINKVSYCISMYFPVLNRIVSYCAALCCIVLYCITMYSYCIVLYCIALYCVVVLYCIILYYNELYCIVLYCVVL